MIQRRSYFWFIAAGVLLLAGCDATPEGIAPPNFDPDAATERAMAEFDADGDGALSAKELKDCASIAATADRFDRDGDGRITADELSATFEDWKKQGAGLVAVACAVKRSGQPVEGATVTFVPEAFLGDAIKPATGITTADGMAALTVAEDELPEEYRGRVHGLHCGIYRVTVTHPEVGIPAKFNTQTTLYRIVTRRDHEMLAIEF